ncbi:uncharacterized protein LOC126836762 [Adelges cooleyi]|uniref:uncharacterized protein LOC126836762 n=1 Tax=Adelges cooleyi TaxID=133065 RepID=UPI00217FB896|nr:uncharacterized protein LOC126836762 [Adelges cooleyi]XP_050426351.1 uncharacterized protein LOC126836762 [Adelges cooleyi]
MTPVRVSAVKRFPGSTVVSSLVVFCVIALTVPAAVGDTTTTVGVTTSTVHVTTTKTPAVVNSVNDLVNGYNEENESPAERVRSKKTQQLDDRRRAMEMTNRQRRQLLLRKKAASNNQSPGLFRLTKILVRDTINDTRTAYRNISEIIGQTLREGIDAPPAPTDDQQMMGSAQESEPTTKRPQGQVTVSAAARKAISKLVGRNFRGLRRLFDSELRNALANSGKNLRDFRRELGKSVRNSLRPSQMFSRGNGTTTNTL